MIQLPLAFALFVFIFGVIGAMRGWAKELLVSFSVLVALFLMDVLSLLGPFKNVYKDPLGSGGFWFAAVPFVAIVIVGYQTPMLLKFGAKKFVRESFADMLLGFFIGLINGWLIVGSLLYFLDSANYPIKGITPPTYPTILLNTLPPKYLQGVFLYISVAISFLFVLLVFI
jgi:uncharacterized membrane protein required for colicin V production